MNRKKCILLAFALVFSALSMSAQIYEKVVRANVWNLGENVNGIRQDTVTVSVAELGGGYEAGGFRQPWEAEQLWNAGASAATVTHLDRFSMRGSFGFEQKNGYGMCGSMFIYPGFYPVDLIEFTPGRKILQTYGFDGGVSVDIVEGWRLGADIDFESSNYSKRKDLRHSNYRLDMEVAPSLMYHSGDWAFGVTYILGKNSETVEAEQIGVGESSYFAFLDKGLMYGAYEMWEGSGVHLAESGIKGFPVKEISHGVSVQVAWKGWYADAGFRTAYGTIGEKQSVWFNFPSRSYDFHIAKNFGTHLFAVEVEGSRLNNRENVLDKVTENGITTTVHLASNTIFSSSSFVVRPEYGYMTDLWDVRAGVEYSNIKEYSSLMYPVVNEEDIVAGRVWASVERKLGIVDLGLSVEYSDADIKEGEYSVDESVVPEDMVFRLEDYHNWKHEYLSASKLGAGLFVKCNIYKGIYIKAEGHYFRGFDLKYISAPGRWITALKLGYNF